METQCIRIYLSLIALGIWLITFAQFAPVLASHRGGGHIFLFLIFMVTCLLAASVLIEVFRRPSRKEIPAAQDISEGE